MYYQFTDYTSNSPKMTRGTPGSFIEVFHIALQTFLAEAGNNNQLGIWYEDVSPNVRVYHINDHDGTFQSGTGDVLYPMKDIRIDDTDGDLVRIYAVMMTSEGPADFPAEGILLRKSTDGATGDAGCQFLFDADTINDSNQLCFSVSISTQPGDNTPYKASNGGIIAFNRWRSEIQDDDSWTYYGLYAFGEGADGKVFPAIGTATNFWAYEPTMILTESPIYPLQTPSFYGAASGSSALPVALNGLPDGEAFTSLPMFAMKTGMNARNMGEAVNVRFLLSPAIPSFEAEYKKYQYNSEEAMVMHVARSDDNLTMEGALLFEDTIYLSSVFSPVELLEGEYELVPNSKPNNSGSSQ